jgi:hypothetical protein
MRNDETEPVGVGNGTQIEKRLVEMKTQMIVALFRSKNVAGILNYQRMAHKPE